MSVSILIHYSIVILLEASTAAWLTLV